MRRLVMYGATFLVGVVMLAAHGVGIGGDKRRVVTVQENDPRPVLVQPGEILNVIMDRHHPDGVSAYWRCLDMGGDFDELGFICRDVDF